MQRQHTESAAVTEAAGGAHCVEQVGDVGETGEEHEHGAFAQVLGAGREGGAAVNAVGSELGSASCKRPYCHCNAVLVPY